MAISAGYSSSNRPAHGVQRQREFGGLLTRPATTAASSINRATRPTPNAQDPIMFLSDPYPSFTGTLPELRPDAAEQPGGRRSQGRRGEARAVQQLQRDAPPSAAGELLGDCRLHRRATARGSAVSTARSTASRSTRSRSMATCCSATLSSQPQLGIPLPYPGFTGTVQQALRPYPQFTSITVPEQLQGQDALRLAADDVSSVISGTTSRCSSPTPCRRPKTTC